MKTAYSIFFLIFFCQVSLAQLNNPGPDDGPRAIIPTQSKPQILRPETPIKKPKTPICNCGNAKTGGGWDGIGFYVGEKPLQKYSCGFQFTVKTYEKIKFASGGYNCIGDSADKGCKASISGTFFKDAAVIRTINPFNFETEVLEFSTPGSYKLELTAKCKNQKCTKCVYYFTVL